MTNTKKYSVKSDLAALLERQEVEEFAAFLPGIKDQCKCLHGCGVDYDRQKIKSLKLYYKILGDLQGNKLLSWFFNDHHFKGGKELYDKSLSSKSKDINSSLGGLGGINFALKLSSGEPTTYSFYIKQWKNQAKVCNFNSNKITTRTYRYVFNKYLIRLLTRYYNVRLPATDHGIEYSIRTDKLFCTIYPDYRLKNAPLSNFLEGLYSNIAGQNEWEIEGEIVCAVNKKYTPITKGFCSRDSMRKLFFGAKADLEFREAKKNF